MIRAFIIAEVRLYREGLAAILSKRDEIAIVGTSVSWAACADEVRARDLDVVLVDMTVADGASAIRAIVQETNGTKVVALAVSEDEREVIACAEAGVSGYVTRSESIDELVLAVQGAADGQLACSPSIAGTLLRRVTALSNPLVSHVDGRLTRREAEIAELLDQGLSNKEIAQRLCITLATVKNHVHSILDKLEIRSRFEVSRRTSAGPHLGRREDPDHWLTLDGSTKVPT
jgi:two-component system, NarL family, nitrate/nitrite response regulator NarL